MRTARKNEQRIWYSVLSSESDGYKTCDDGEDLYIEVDGERVPVETGVPHATYTMPVEDTAHITPLGSESYARGNKALDEFYGVDVSKYEALIVAVKGMLGLNETAIVWHQHEPVYLSDGSVDPLSADYQVRRVAYSLNNELFLMTRQERGGDGN